MNNGKLWLHSKWLAAALWVEQVADNLKEVCLKMLAALRQRRQARRDKLTSQHCPSCSKRAWQLNWLEDSLRRVGWSHLPSKRDYATLMYRHTMFQEAMHTDGMKAYMAAQRDMRAGIITDLCNGTLDKWGEEHDCCKRAVLHYLNRALELPLEAEKEFEAARVIQERQDKRAEVAMGSPLDHF